MCTPHKQPEMDFSSDIWATFHDLFQDGKVIKNFTISHLPSFASIIIFGWNTIQFAESITWVKEKRNLWILC